MPFGRRVGVTAIVVGSLFVVGSALGDGGDPDAKSSDTPTSASTPHPKASSTPTLAGDKAATPASKPKPALLNCWTARSATSWKRDTIRRRSRRLLQTSA